MSRCKKPCPPPAGCKTKDYQPGDCAKVMVDGCEIDAVMMKDGHWLHLTGCMPLTWGGISCGGKIIDKSCDPIMLCEDFANMIDLGLTFNSEEMKLDAWIDETAGLQFGGTEGRQIQIKVGQGVEFSPTGEVQAKLGDGVEFSPDGKIQAKLGPGLCFNADGQVMSRHMILNTFNEAGDFVFAGWPSAGTIDDLAEWDNLAAKVPLTEAHNSICGAVTISGNEWTFNKTGYYSLDIKPVTTDIAGGNQFLVQQSPLTNDFINEDKIISNFGWLLIDTTGASRVHQQMTEQVMVHDNEYLTKPVGFDVALSTGKMWVEAGTKLALKIYYSMWDVSNARYFTSVEYHGNPEECTSDC